MKRTSRIFIAFVSLLTVLTPLELSGVSHADEVNSVSANGNGGYYGGNTVPSVGASIETSNSGGGYYILGTDGGVFSFGDAPFYGSAAGATNTPFVDMATSSKGGYWLTGEDGGVFTFGSADFHGSLGGHPLNGSIVGMAPTSTGNGYWLVGEDGGVFAFGDANFYGSAALWNVKSIVDILPTADNGGYWLVASDGGVFSFGDAQYRGNAVGTASATVVDAATNGSGYWLLTSDGNVYSYGANYYGNSPSNSLGATALTPRKGGDGYWILRSLNSSGVPANSGSGRRIVYSNSKQRVWLVEANGAVYRTYLVSGKIGVPSPGSYHVFSKSLSSTAHNGSLILPYMTRFAFGHSLAIGFHGIPLRGNGTPIESDDELGQYRSAGCVRQNQSDAHLLYDWTPVGTLVVVLA